MTESKNSQVNKPAGFVDQVLILGGGQLSRMLTLSAQAMGFQPTVLCEKKDEPAPQVGALFLQGNDQSYEALHSFFSKPAATATFENEFLDVKALEKSAEGTSVVFRPSLSALSILQDKLKQKELLSRAGVEYGKCFVFNAENPDDDIKQAQKLFPRGFVLKWSRLGYDGKGTWISPSSLNEEALKNARGFLQQAAAKDVKVFAEEKIEFTSEVAMIAARAIDGSIATYPLVISEQADGICKWVRGPARALGVPEAIERTAQNSLEKLLKELGYVGIMACEFFVTVDGRLLVNELAPRVHNSGHYSQNGSSVSQFDNHMRAVLGFSLQKPKTPPYFMMGNLIGPRGVALNVANCPLLIPLPRELSLHWYGKREIRPGRKVGHVNAVAETADEFAQVEKALRSFVKNWEDGLVSCNEIRNL